MTLPICLKYITRYAVETVYLLIKYCVKKTDYGAGLFLFFIVSPFVNIVHSNGEKRTSFFSSTL